MIGCCRPASCTVKSVSDREAALQEGAPSEGYSSLQCCRHSGKTRRACVWCLAATHALQLAMAIYDTGAKQAQNWTTSYRKATHPANTERVTTASHCRVYGYSLTARALIPLAVATTHLAHAGTTPHYAAATNSNRSSLSV